MSKKIFVFDIDGTLVNDNNIIQRATKKTLIEIHKKGNFIILASARPAPSIKEIARKLSVPVTGIIALNGAVAFYKDEIILAESISKTTFKKIIDLAKNNNIHLNVYTKNNWYIENQSPYLVKEKKFVGLEPDLINDFNKIKAEVFKVLLLGSSKEIISIKKKLINHIDSIEVTISNENYCEIVRKGTSKGRALYILRKELKKDYQLGDTIVFGDGENDIEMMKRANLSIAMGNSCDKVKKTADYVTLENNSNAITYAVNKYKLLRGD